MELYTNKDVDLVESEVDKLTDIIEEKKATLFEPTKKELLIAIDHVLEFVKKNKRKVYGGYAQNKLIINKNKEDAFYDDSEFPDIDVYTPKPLEDLREVADILHQKGFKDVRAGEAIHKETYNVSVGGTMVLDLSYVPTEIYNNMPFVQIDGMNYVAPEFIYIDLYKIFTEPYFSSRRWKKTFKRLKLLQKHYPFNKPTKKLNDSYDPPKKSEETVEKINKVIYDFIKDKETFIIIGQYAYNYYLEQSKINNDQKIGKLFEQIKYPFMQLISTNYVIDTVKLYTVLSNIMKGDSKLSFKEHNPFWGMTGYGTIISYDNHPVLHIVAHDNKCLPVRVDKARFYNSSKTVVENDHKLTFGSFDLVLLMNLISNFRVKVTNTSSKYHYHKIMTSHLGEMRSYYLKKSGKNLLDKSPFQSLIIDCVGKAVDPVKCAMARRKENSRKGKMIVYRYDPENPKPKPDFKFFNSSGNEIRNTSNLKVTKYINDESKYKELLNSKTQQTSEEEVNSC